MRVVAAILNYNDANYCKDLLGQVLKQKFDKVFVLDDASTDESPTVYQSFPKANIVHGKRNLGDIGNKNRMLKQDSGDIIFFLDADMRLLTKNIPDIIRTAFGKHKNLGILGVKVLDKHGHPIIFDYHQNADTLLGFIGGGLRYLYKRPRPEHYTSSMQKVSWTLEGACAVRSSLFRQLQGFDEGLKHYGEGPDLSKRAGRVGMATYMTSGIQVEHRRSLSQQNWREFGKFIHSSILFYKKHGFVRKRSK